MCRGWGGDGVGAIVGGEEGDVGERVKGTVEVDVRAEEKEHEGVEDERAKVFDHEHSAPADLRTW